MTAGVALPPSLSPRERRAYAEDGFLVVRGLFGGAEMAVASMEAERLLGRDDLKDTNNIRCRWQNHVGTGECLFETFDPVTDISPVCDRLARDPRLVGLVSALYGEPAKHFDDCARFEVDRPSLVVALYPSPQQPGGALNHVGLRFPDSADLVEVQRRLEEAGIPTQRQEGVECCYAR